jgi:hypothetical protein
MDNDQRLVPYSVYLRKDIHDKLREAAQDRKAASMVRDAITMLVEGEDAFNAGYNKALRDICSLVSENKMAKGIAVDGVTVADSLVPLIEDMIVIQSPNRKTNAKKKT